LDRHVASRFVLFHQLRKHHWLVEGPQFGDLHAFLGEAYEQVHVHVDDSAERINALGGFPASNPVEQARLAYIEHEPEGAFQVLSMLARDLKHLGTIAQQMHKTIRLVQEMVDPGTEHLLKTVLLSQDTDVVLQLLEFHGKLLF
jgi:DNA-binding ferritin-like protein